MPVLRMAELPWTEIAALDRARCVALLPVGAIEAHGPHLPLGTDVVIAEAMAAAAAERLDLRGVTALLLPALAYTAAPFAAAFAGTLSLRPETVTETVVAIGRSLAAAGIPLLAIANAHFDPTHVHALRAAAEELGKEGKIAVAFPNLTRRALAARLTEEFQSGACHAGRYEGSLVLASRPDLVREDVQRALPPHPISLTAAMREGKTTFAEAGGPDAYFGDPAAASRQEGEATLDVLAAILEEAVLAALDIPC
ncbi:MAG TPA: creatininase family protein [Thermoanaerobaculia bacterium]|nr:creatininase family protein [Thermoanaerobaculia bacterium]